MIIEPQGILTGAEVLALHGNSMYRVRRPIEFGNLAISTNYTRTEVQQDL
jgi:aminoglycoside phosphotransferase family enzyme